MIQVSTEFEMRCYNNTDELLDNILKDYGKYGDVKEIKVTNFIMDRTEYKYALDIETVYDIWFYFEFYTIKG